VQIFAVAWACSVIGLARTALLYSIAATMNAAVHPASWGDNSWKYAFAWSISVMIISVLARAPRVLQFLAIIGITLYALAHDSRNSAGALLLAVLVTCLAYAVYRNSRRGRDILLACLLGVCAIGTYSVVTQLALDGYLGQTLQRTQMGQSSSQTPMAGRPEYGATFALMHAKPMGLGPGVLPSGNDVQVGKTGLANLGLVPSGSYVDGYMFHDAFEVHSVAGDLWVQFGIPGLILAGMILVALVRATLLMYRSKPSGDTALCLFLMFAALWDLLFSPLDANFRIVGFAAGVALWVIAARTSTNATATTNATGRV
jgi:O-antigen ligase